MSLSTQGEILVPEDEEASGMKKQLLRLLLCAGLLAGLFTVTALAADWTYDPTAQTLTIPCPATPLCSRT